MVILVRVVQILELRDDLANAVSNFSISRACP